ncbi:hypothetical protein [Staphylospora marina]|uniref:hypothetical protein n=1 Tax=Staphylospora marina TaxID=2490858 RepID=UPI000F5BDD0C|nr:hypothetical protein [Staphylospora marina]
MDPGRLLESFRTDVSSRNLYTDLLRQFDLEHPNRKGNRKKRGTPAGRNVNRTAAILSLCLVTGLSLGIGSAFADGDIPPETAPPDQPPGSSKVKTELPVKTGREVERPVREERPPDMAGRQSPGIGKREAPRDQTGSASGQRGGSVPERKDVESPPPDMPGKRDQRGREETRKPAETKRPALTLPGGGTLELPPVLELPKELAGGNPNGNSSVDDGEKTGRTTGESRTIASRDMSSGVTSTTGKSDNSGAGSVQSSGKTSSGVREKAKEENRPKQQEPVVTVSAGTPPKTVDGAELPKTASGDLDGVIGGGLAALIGSLYLIRRNGDDRE